MNEKYKKIIAGGAVALVGTALVGGMVLNNKSKTNDSSAGNTGSTSSENKVDSIDYDCKDFGSHQEAQDYFESQGGSPSNNVDRLDRDRDGLACEAN